MLTKQVALANETYERLKRKRLPGESFSEAIDRLLDHQTKDPMIFLRAPRSKLDPDERIRLIEEDRNASWEQA